MTIGRLVSETFHSEIQKWSQQILKICNYVNAPLG